MKYPQGSLRGATIILMLLPALLCAQEFQFRQEYDTIPVEINGWRTYQPWVGGFSKSTPQFCDINGDSIKDLFVGNFLGQVSYFRGTDSLGNYRLEFETSQFDSISVSGPPWGGSSDPCFGDLDADGDLDLIVGDANSYTHYYRNIGNSQSPEYELITDSLVPQGPPWVSSPELIDIDADGDFDLIAGWQQLTYYRNEGTTQVYNFVLASSNFAGVSVSGAASPNFIDIDADGDLDLFVGNEAGRIYFYRNDGTPLQYNFTYVSDFYNNIDVGGYASPEFADIDGDGDYDLLVGRENYSTTYDPGDVFFYENIGTPSMPQWILRTKNYLALDEGAGANNCGTDINADFDMDIFLMNMGDHLSYFENIGDSVQGSFSFRTGSYQDLNVDDGSPFFTDIDGDQDPDLFIGEALLPNPPYPGLHLFRNTGSPQSASFSLYSSNLVPYNFDVAIRPTLADIDADGDEDLFIRDNSFAGTFYFFENVGSPAVPQFASPVLNWQGLSLAGAHWSCFYDIDDDGDLDYFITLATWANNDFVGFYLNTGSPQNPNFVFQTSTFLQLDGGKFVLEGIDIVDIDHDGDGDFFLGTAVSGGMLFFRNITGDTSAVGPPPVQRHPRAGLQISLGPNPANPFVVASFELRVASNMSLDIFDISGRKIVELASGFHLPGEYRYVWDASKNASGIYIIRLETPQQSLSEKLTIVK